MNHKWDLAYYGNMTEAEKRLNWNDLVAYKNKEWVSYNLVPGIHSQT